MPTQNLSPIAILARRVMLPNQKPVAELWSKLDFGQFQIFILKKRIDQKLGLWKTPHLLWLKDKILFFVNSKWTAPLIFERRLFLLDSKWFYVKTLEITQKSIQRCANSRSGRDCLTQSITPSYWQIEIKRCASKKEQNVENMTYLSKSLSLFICLFAEIFKQMK